jgi:hypothetical protein
MTSPYAVPFADPGVTSTRPTVASLRGRLVIITPRKIETVPSNMNKGHMEDRVTADVQVVDGLGPVPQFKNHQPTGVMLEGPDFTGVWISNTRVVDQLRQYVGTGTGVIGVLDTWQPGTQPVKGNPWGIVAATDEQKQHASNYLASRAIGAAAAPAPQPQTYTSMQATPPPAPVYGQPAPQQAQNPFAQTSPQPAAPAGYPQPAAPITTAAAPVPEQAPPAAPAPYVPAPGSAPANVNPFASFA